MSDEKGLEGAETVIHQVGVVVVAPLLGLREGYGREPAGYQLCVRDLCLLWGERQR